MRASIGSLMFCAAIAVSACEDVPCLPTGEVTVRAVGTLAGSHGDLPACFASGQLVTLGETRTAWIDEDGNISFEHSDLAATVDIDLCQFTITQNLDSETQTGEATWYAEEKKSRQRWDGFGVIELSRSDGDCGNSIGHVTIDVMVVP